jgi:hypothetical protein
MRSKSRETDPRRSAAPAWHLLLVAALILALFPAAAQAANYFVVGRVYSAGPVADGDEVPVNPLTGEPADEVLGAGVAVVPRNLVEVRVLNASDSSELASYITRQDGGYLASFSVPSPTVEVRFVVEELATSKQLLYSEPTTLAPPVTVRHLLVAEAATEISDGRATIPSALAPPPGKYTAIFTRVGKIELATEVSGSTQHLIDPSSGLANVPAAVAADLAIPAYEDAPFGGNLYLFGAFSQALYSLPGVCYKVRIYPDPADHTTFSYMDDPLVKTKYTVNLTAGTVDTERVTLGPDASSCYQLTPLSATLAGGLQEFWSFPDLLALWRTGGLDGDHELEIEVSGLGSPSDFVHIVDYTDVTLTLDNVAPSARIEPLVAGDFDTPRVYNPGPAPASADLLGSLLGSFPADYGGTGDPTCQIFSLQPLVPTKYLAFRLTARHPNGYLRYWDFRFERNDDQNEVVLGKRYDGSTNTMVDQTGVRVSSSQTSTSGFSDRFLYLDAAHLEPSGAGLGGCAYRFLIRAATRTTDGYHYLRHSHDDDVHYVQK